MGVHSFAPRLPPGPMRTTHHQQMMHVGRNTTKVRSSGLCAVFLCIPENTPAKCVSIHAEDRLPFVEKVAVVRVKAANNGQIFLSDGALPTSPLVDDLRSVGVQEFGGTIRASLGMGFAFGIFFGVALCLDVSVGNVGCGAAGPPESGAALWSRTLSNSAMVLFKRSSNFMFLCQSFSVPMS